MALHIPAWVGIRAFLTSKKFLIPAAIILLLLAVGGGTYWYLNKQTNDLVAAKVEQADSNATIKSYEAKEEIDSRTQAVDQKFDTLQRRTAQDYNNARIKANAAPVEERDAQAPRVIIDNLNELDRLRNERDSGGIPDPEVPVG